MPKDEWCGYDASNEKIAALYSKGKRLQWDADSLDWSRPVDPGCPVHREIFPLLSLPIFGRLGETQIETLGATLFSQTLSQFLHSELAGLMIASRLVGLCPDFEVKLFAATQTMDEARHVEVFSRYVKRCSPDGTITPISPSLQRFLQKILDADSWLKMLIATQIIGEGGTLNTYHGYRKRVRDPLFAGVLDGVIRDEARHVGFGTISLRETVERMSDDEREELADYVFDTVLAYADTPNDSIRIHRSALEGVGISLDDVKKDSAALLAAGKPLPIDPIRAGIVEFIIPTLRRTGVLTARVEDKLTRARLVASPESTLLEQLDALVEQENARVDS